MIDHSIDQQMRSCGNVASAWFAAAALAWTLCGGSAVLEAQAPSGCAADGYRVIAQRWDPVLKRAWESRQECTHPDWPLRMVAMSARADDASATGPAMIRAKAAEPATETMQQPLLVKAGDTVRVWMQDSALRIEMTGVVDRSARRGDRVGVQMTRHDEETGLTVQRIEGTVSGLEEVEMGR
jgi:hypothetical protein